MQAFGEAGALAGLKDFELLEHAVEMGGRGGGRELHLDVCIKGDEADHVLLVGEQIGEAGGEMAGVIELGLGVGACAEFHGAAGVENKGGAEVGFLLIELDVVAIGAGISLPVEMAQLVAGDVFAMLGEFD